MKVKITEMRRAGVELPRRSLPDLTKHEGDLEVMHTGDQGLRRPALLARLYETGTKRIKKELVDPHIVWMSGGRFVLAGFQRTKNPAGETVDYAQSWLCVLDADEEGLDDTHTWKYGRQGRY